MGYGVIAVNERSIKLLEMDAIKLSSEKIITNACISFTSGTIAHSHI